MFGIERIQKEVEGVMERQARLSRLVRQHLELAKEGIGREQEVWAFMRQTVQEMKLLEERVSKMEVVLEGLCFQRGDK